MKISSEKIKSSNTSDQQSNLSEVSNIINDINFIVSHIMDDKVQALDKKNISLNQEILSIKTRIDLKTNNVKKLSGSKQVEIEKKDLVLNFLDMIENYNLEKTQLDNIITIINNINTLSLSQIKNQNKRIIETLKQNMI